MATTCSFFTNHARAMLLIAARPDTRLRDLAAALDLTERTASTIVADLTAAGFLLKERVGRRNHYAAQHHLPLPDVAHLPREAGEHREYTLGDLLSLFT